MVFLVSTAPAPLLVQETSVPGAVRLIWDNLEANLRRGEVVEYRVEYKEPDSPTVSAIVVGPGVNEKLLSGADFFKSFLVLFFNFDIFLFCF